VDELKHILESLERSLGPVGGEPVPLEGGITNRNYRVQLGGEDYVVRLHGKDTELLGISREAERIANDAAAGLGIAPAVAAGFDGGLVTSYVRCTTLDEGAVAARVDEIARALRAFHDTRVALPVSFWVPDLLEHYAKLIRQQGAALPALYEQAVEVAACVTGALPARDLRPCHNDLLSGNLIASAEDGRVMIVDWEYAGMGLPSFDLGNLSVNNNFDEGQDEQLLRTYLGRSPLDAETASLRLARVLSDAREGAWGVMQEQVSELDFDFAGYAEQHFARMQEAVAAPEFGRWLAAAAA
jgi:thiamine kinase-like enzyme